MEKRKIRRSLHPAEPPPPPLPPKDHGEVQFTDPRRFKFAIVCMSCMGKQETRAHLKNRPSGLAVDVLCGHCEFRTSSWPAMRAHLNAPGMQRKVACKPEYRLTLPVKPAFRRASLPLQSSVIPTATVAASQPSERGSLLTWRSPPQLVLSPSRDEAREKRHMELRTTLMNWTEKNPNRIELRGPGRNCLTFLWSQCRLVVNVNPVPQREVQHNLLQLALTPRKPTLLLKMLGSGGTGKAKGLWTNSCVRNHCQKGYHPWLPRRSCRSRRGMVKRSGT